MKKLYPLILCLLIFQSPGAFADEEIRQVQQKLKEMEHYDGAVDGISGSGTETALRRYQIAEGLPVTGEIDPGTLTALGLNGGGGRASGGPRPVISEQERARHVLESDRDYLSGQTDLTIRRQIPAARRPVARKNGRPLISESDAADLVQRYLRAASQSSPDAEMSYYAPQIEYFGRGKVGRDFVRKDQERYYAKWPRRKFDLIGRPVLVERSDEEAVVRYRVEYAVSNSERKLTGKTENTLKLRTSPSGLKIGGISEKPLDR